MCEAIKYYWRETEVITQFSDENPLLPVRLKSGNNQLVPWGNTLIENGFPSVGVAHLDHIYADKWSQFYPKPVKIPYISYMQKSLQGEMYWFENKEPEHCFLKGLLAFIGKRHRVYLVVKNVELFDADKFSFLPVKIFVYN